MVLTALSMSWGHYNVFLGKTVYSDSASFYPELYKWVLMNLMLGVLSPAMD